MKEREREVTANEEWRTAAAGSRRAGRSVISLCLSLSRSFSLFDASCARKFVAR